MSNLIEYVKCIIIFYFLYTHAWWCLAWKEQGSVRESYSLARLCAWWFFSPPSIANVYHADYSGVRVLWPQIYHWDSLAGCSSRHLRVERGTTATFQADWHMTRVLDIVGTVTYGDKWNIKVGSEREKFTYRPVTRLKQRNNGNKLNICLSLLLFMIMLTLLCV